MALKKPFKVSVRRASAGWHPWPGRKKNVAFASVTLVVAIKLGIPAFAGMTLGSVFGSAAATSV